MQADGVALGVGIHGHVSRVVHRDLRLGYDHLAARLLDILKAQELIEGTVGQAPNLEDIAARVSMSRRTFIRRFKAATGSTPRDYQQRARTEAAKRLLEGSKKPVAEVASRVGYEDISAFRRLFQRHPGTHPRTSAGATARPRAQRAVIAKAT